MHQANPRKRVRADLDVIVETIVYLMTESRRLSREQCARFGVTATQVSVLKLLREIGDLSLGDLSRRLQAQNSTVTGIADRLVRDGLVTREQSPEDRRVWLIGLTDRGRKLARDIDVSPWETLREAVEALPHIDQERLTALLRKVADNVNRMVAAQGPQGQAAGGSNGKG
jgi:DNA-binding MarR family transcriptional regulator